MGFQRFHKYIIGTWIRKIRIQTTFLGSSIPIVVVAKIGSKGYSRAGRKRLDAEYKSFLSLVLRRLCVFSSFIPKIHRDLDLGPSSVGISWWIWANLLPSRRPFGPSACIVACSVPSRFAAESKT
jgi:hypothetical protein